MNSKQLTIFLLASLWMINITTGQTMGINFIEGDFYEAQKQAKEQNKMIFMDAYAVWCAPCKRMDKDIFSNGSVGDIYNEKFISIKVDMEKGEGVALAQKYGVQAYPTFLFLDPEGAVLHRGVGFKPIPEFLELAETASDPEKQLGSMNRRFFNGNREPKFLMDYAEALMEVMDPKASEVIGEYLQTQESWDNDESRELLMMAIEQAEGPYYEYMVENRGSFISQFGPKQYEEKVYRSSMRTMMVNDEMNPTAAEYYFRNAYPEESEKMLYRFRMHDHRSRGEHEEYATVALERHEKYPIDNAMELNAIAWYFYENIDKKKTLKKGLKLALESIAIVKQYDNMDTAAALYYKLGKKRKARKYAHEAIEIARSMGLDPKETQALLNKINGKAK